MVVEDCKYDALSTSFSFALTTPRHLKHCDCTALAQESVVFAIRASCRGCQTAQFRLSGRSSINCRTVLNAAHLGTHALFTRQGAGSVRRESQSEFQYPCQGNLPKRMSNPRGMQRSMTECNPIGQSLP